MVSIYNIKHTKHDIDHNKPYKLKISMPMIKIYDIKMNCDYMVKTT